MDTPVVKCAQAAYFVLGSSSGNVGLEPDAAFRFARDQGWLPQRAAVDDPISLGAFSFLIMKAFNIKGGLLYTIFPGPRYAFRSMTSLNIIQGTADPAMTVSGERFLLILGNALKVAEGES